MKSINTVLGLLYCFSAALTHAQLSAPAGQLETSIRPLSYELAFSIDPSREVFAGETRIDVLLNEPLIEIWMHGDGLEIISARLEHSNGQSIAGEFEQLNITGSARLVLEEIAPAGQATLYFSYTAPFSSVNTGLFRSERDDRSYVASQLAPTHARAVFPSFDEPRFKVPFDISVTTRVDDVVISNAPEAATEARADGQVRHMFATTEPLPTYLVFVAVGPYDVVTWNAVPRNSVRDRELPLRAIASRGLGGGLNYALRNTADLLEAIEVYFDRPYPYAKLDFIAVPSSIGGAMENAGAITYDEFLVLMDDSSPVSQRRTYTYIHAHELAHMWFGDLVTARWWTDIWLNEAFATWLSYKIAQGYWPAGNFDRLALDGAMRAMVSDSLESARQIREPVLRDAEISDVFDSITYDKGAGVLAMLEGFIGEEAFREGIRRHIARFPHNVADSDDFIASMAEGSGRPEIEGAFRSFIDQPGVPLVEARLQCPSDAAPRVQVSQSRYRPLGSTIDSEEQSWEIPICIAHWGDTGRGRTCALVSASEDVIELNTPSCPETVHPNADGAGYYRFSLDESGWTALTENASSLTPNEALAAADSLDAAFRAGVLSADIFVAGLVALAERPEWDVVSVVSSRLVSIGSILDSDRYESLKDLLGITFRGRLLGLERDDSDDALLARANLNNLLALTAKDETIRADLATFAAARIGYGGNALDANAIEPEFVETAISVGVQEYGRPFFEMLFAAAETTSDAAFRQAALNALARVEEPSLAQRLREMVLDGTIRGEEALRMLRIQLARRATRLDAWEWIKANAESVIAMTPETFRSRSIPSFGQSFCTIEQEADLSIFVAANADALPGHERSLAQTQEQIGLCASLRGALADELYAALNRAIP